jgi:hypothetical protein
LFSGPVILNTLPQDIDEGGQHMSHQKTALDLARAIRRYDRMQPWNACAALYDEWPPAIANIIDAHMWSEVKAKTVPEIAREMHALMKKAEAASRAVQEGKQREAKRARKRAAQKS